MLLQHPLAIRVYLNLVDTLPPRSLEAKVKAAEAGEQGNILHRLLRSMTKARSKRSDASPLVN